MRPSRAVWLVSGMAAAVFLAHLYVIAPLGYFTVMDEHYYIFVAQEILSRTVCLPQAVQLPNTCNFEHPPLAKALIAAGISAFGDDTYGWRISSVLAGSLSVPLLYLIAKRLSNDRKLSLLAAGFLSLDTLFFAQSTVAMLDVPEVFFALAAFAIYLYGLRLGPVNWMVLSGAVLGLSILSKETGAFLLATLVTYHILFAGGTLRARAKGALEVVAASVLVFAVGLQVYDSLFTTYPIFTDQILYILRFGSSFKSPTPLPILSILSNNPLVYNFAVQAQGCMSCARSGPFDWLTFYYPIDFLTIPMQNFTLYLTADVPIVWAVYAWVPLSALALVGLRGAPLSGPARLGAFALVWFLWNYLPYVVLYAFSRYMFVWYLIPAVPALSLGAAYLTTRSGFPRWLLVLYVAVVVAWFIVFFPNRGIL